MHPEEKRGGRRPFCIEKCFDHDAAVADSFAKQSSDHTKFCGVWGKAPRSSFPLSLTFTAFAAISGAAGTTAAAASVPYHVPYGEKQPYAYRSDKHIIQYSHCSHYPQTPVKTA